MIRLVFVLGMAHLISSQVSLEYKPTLPFYHPKPGNYITQIVPPGKPWPANLEGYQNFSQTGSNPIIVDRLKEDEKKISTTPKTRIENLGNSIVTEQSSTTTKKIISLDILEYQPTKPFYFHKPDYNEGLIVPPGKPWPANLEGYENFSQTGNNPIKVVLVDRLKEEEQSSTNKKPQESGTTSSKVINLEYKPTQPFYFHKPDYNEGLIVPPGQPWPANQAGYSEFSQTTPPPPKLVDRFNEESTTVKVKPYWEIYIDRLVELGYGKNNTTPKIDEFFVGNPEDSLEEELGDGKVPPFFYP